MVFSIRCGTPSKNKSKTKNSNPPIKDKEMKRGKKYWTVAASLNSWQMFIVRVMPCWEGQNKVSTRTSARNKKLTQQAWIFQRGHQQVSSISPPTAITHKAWIRKIFTLIPNFWKWSEKISMIWMSWRKIQWCDPTSQGWVPTVVWGTMATQ